MNYKTTFLTLILAFTGLMSFSQKTVYADDIMKDIRAGKDVIISNATIDGTLDLTDMELMLENLPKKRSRKKGNSIYNIVKSKISFTNCTFERDVLAYIPDHDKSGYTFIANFENQVTFKNCYFNRRAMFKHSSFSETSSFENTEFQGDSTFKHANFKEASNFTGAKFENDTSFKHVQFSKYISFESSIFDDNANFKHAIFRNGLSLRDAKFKGDLDIKHTIIKGDFKMSGMKVLDDIDSKHTMINGKSFTTYLLNNR